MRTYPKEVQREQLVTIANLGLSQSIRNIRESIQQACLSTELEFIDIVTLEVDDSTFRNGQSLAEQIEVLEELYSQEILSGYGIHMKLSPYIFHTPKKSRANDMSTVPILLENELANRKNCLLVLYNISPSIHTPATFPMLSHPDEAAWAPHDLRNRDEAPRSFVRAAFDPLTCYRGFGVTGDSGDLDASELQRLADANDKDSGPSSHGMGGEGSELLEDAVHQPLVLISGIHPPQLEHIIAQAMNDLCPSLQPHPRLEDKALLVGLSVGTDAVVVEGNQSAKIGKLSINRGSIPDSDATMDIFGSFMVPFSK